MYKLVYDRDETNLIIDKLASGNNSIIKDTAQKLAEESSKGRIILKSMQGKVINILNGIMKNPNHKPIYKWIYKCVCYYSDEESEKILTDNFVKETDSECRVWIISAISSRYKEEHCLMKTLSELKERTGALELEKERLFYAISLFSKLPIRKMSKEFTQDIINSKDIHGMIWLTKLYAFPMQTKRRGLDNLIDDEIISSLSYSEDEQVQLYTYWSMINHKSYNLLGLDDISKKNIKSDVLKWYYYGMIEGQFIRRNFDYIVDIIYLCIYNYYDKVRIKQGVINALLSLPYESYFDNAIVQWFYNEESDEIKIVIIEYMVKNVKSNNCSENCKYGTYFEILKDEYDSFNYRFYIYSYAKVYKTLNLLNDTLEIEENQYNEKEKNPMSLEIQTLISHSDISNSQIGGQNNQQYNGGGVDKELGKLLEEFINVCSNKELRNECNELKTYSNSPMFKDKVNKLVSNIASWLTIASAAPTVVDIANKLINYLGQF